MNLQRPNANDATRTANRSRSVVPMSGLCTRCVDGCTGNCEVFKATFRGRELIYPGPFGDVTAGGDKDYPVDYSHLNIQGYALGANGMPAGVEGNPDTATFPSVSTETEYGWEIKTKLKVPIFTGALGSTEIARKNWEHFDIGAAISGILASLAGAGTATFFYEHSTLLTIVGGLCFLGGLTFAIATSIRKKATCSHKTSGSNQEQ